MKTNFIIKIKKMIFGLRVDSVGKVSINNEK